MNEVELGWAGAEADTEHTGSSFLILLIPNINPIHASTWDTVELDVLERNVKTPGKLHINQTAWQAITQTDYNTWLYLHKHITVGLTQYTHV
jgi:hypothetical protein